MSTSKACSWRIARLRKLRPQSKVGTSRMTSLRSSQTGPNAEVRQSTLQAALCYILSSAVTIELKSAATGGSLLAPCPSGSIRHWPQLVINNTQSIMTASLVVVNLSDGNFDTRQNWSISTTFGQVLGSLQTIFVKFVATMPFTHPPTKPLKPGD